MTADPTRVREVDELGEFIDLPYRLHRDDSAWVAPLRFDVRARLDRARNPFFEHAEAAYFVAERADRVVGRVAAIVNRLHDEVHADRVGFFGFFESVDDDQVAAALLEAAASWCAARGCVALRGPASFSVNDECGLLVETFDAPPTFMMPYNPPYYARLIEAAGFGRVRDLLAWETTSTVIPDRLERLARSLAERRGFDVRALEMRRFASDIEQIKTIYNRAWEKNWGFVPMTDHEIDHMARQFRPLAVPELIPFAEHDGEAVAFGLAMPDLNEVLRANRSGRLFPAALQLVWRRWRRRYTRLRILLLGILPEHRGHGLDVVLYHWIWRRALELGYRWGEAGWILEDNDSMNSALAKIGFRQYRRYRLYERPIVMSAD